MPNLKRLYQITSDSDLSYEQKMDALLQLGLNYFQLELAIIGQIKDNDYIVRHAISPDNSLLVGTIFPVAETYC